MFETIVALATPPMKSALAIVRLSGDDCFDIVSKCFSKELKNIDMRTTLIGEIHDEGTIVDKVVLIAYVGPKSFTGENAVEIICHGSMLIVGELITVLLKHGAREAKRGEFSERSFLHQKMDLIQAEAVNDLINAETHEAKQLSMFALEGTVSKLIIPLKHSLMDLVSNIEVTIDYPEYTDIEEVNKEAVIKYVENNLPLIEDLISGGEKGKIISKGLKVALVGKPNVGKSSLLNSLLQEDKAIVTEIAGTTRDVVEGDINIDGLLIRLLDTAGIRESKDTIESIGIIKSQKSIQEADLVIVILEVNNIDEEDKKILSFTENKKRIIVYNKSDLLTIKNEEGIYISALKDETAPLKKEILRVMGISKEDFTNPSLISARQVGLVKHVKELLLQAKEEAKAGIPIDLLSAVLRSAYRDILDILGEGNDVDILGEIFSRFCVGK